MPNSAPMCHKVLALAATVATMYVSGTEASPARDRQDEMSQAGYYYSLGASAVSSFSLDTTSPSLSPARIRTRPGYEIDAGLGYRTRDFRIEGAIIYGRFDAESIRFAGGGGALSGYFDLQGAMIDTFYDLNAGSRLRPYVGAGLGLVRFRANDVTLAGFPPTVGDNTLASRQLMAGISYVLDSWRLVAGYRYMEMGAQDYETGGVPLRGEPVRTDAFRLGVQFSF